MVRRALLVDPNANRLDLFRRQIPDGVDVTACTHFRAARECLLSISPQYLISNLRLGMYNGLHLAHLAAHARLATTCLLYDERLDLHLAFEAQLIGAFYETTSRMPFALPAFMQAPLPERDRRDWQRVDRRGLFRGGRRSTDLTFEQLRGLTSGLLH